MAKWKCCGGPHSMRPNFCASELTFTSQWLNKCAQPEYTLQGAGFGGPRCLSGVKPQVGKKPPAPPLSLFIHILEMWLRFGTYNSLIGWVWIERTRWRPHGRDWVWWSLSLLFSWWSGPMGVLFCAVMLVYLWHSAFGEDMDIKSFVGAVDRMDRLKKNLNCCMTSCCCWPPFLGLRWVAGRRVVVAWRCVSCKASGFAYTKQLLKKSRKSRSTADLFLTQRVERHGVGVSWSLSLLIHVPT